MKDKQRETFEQLVITGLPNLIRNKSVSISDDLKLSFDMIDIDTHNTIKGDDGTVFVYVTARCTLKNIHSTGSITFNVNLLKLPVYQELGFMIRGNYMQMLDSYDKTSGLHTLRKQNQSSDMDTAVLQDEHFKSIGFVRSKSKFYTELALRGKVEDAIQVSPLTFLRAVTGMQREELISKFGYSNEYVVSLLDGNSSTFPERKAGFPTETRNDCIQAVYAAIFGKKAALNRSSGTISQKLDEINRWLFNENYFIKGSYTTQRIRYMQGFGYRAVDTVLSESVSSNGIEFSDGTLLTAQLLRELDATELTEIKVTADEKDYVIHKFAPYWFGALNYTLAEDIESLGLKKGTVVDLDVADQLNSSNLSQIMIKDTDGKERQLTRDINNRSLTVDDIFVVFDIWVNNLNGLGIYDKQFDLTNRRLLPFDKLVLEYVDNHLNSIIRRIKNNYTMNGRDSDFEYYIDTFDKDINTDAFINAIRSPKKKLGQMSEMCNVMSFVTKDYKSTIPDLKNIDDDLITIQDHQYGRTDPLDIPESKKLASVQYRTVTSGLNDEGCITTPYIRISNGEVVSEEPVYLTAVDETDRYIAEWNETFKNDDGSPKKYIKARYNGDIVSTDIKNISYRELSPYSGMSIAHACIVFPGHSDAKRITMGCNQLSQAVPMAHVHRPYVNAGGESMIDYGFYFAKGVLESFYNSSILHRPYLKKYKDKILSSDIKLISKHTEHGSMSLVFAILAMNDLDRNLPTFEGQAGQVGTAFNTTDMTTYSLEVPYAVQTTDNTIFTFNINPMPGNVYHPDDIICYNNSCSLEDLEHSDCMETGSHALDSSKFNKGLALTNNLRVGYKTWEGSTIDDAITISDDCLYDDLLTSIFTTRIILDAKVFSETESERFGILEHNIPYFEETGLPKVGTYLNPGDPVISKISITKSKQKAKYKCLKMNQSGQVIYAGFTKKNGAEVAEVILAQRAVVDVGDKFAGRCGNKGVVAKIVPAEQMPYDPETGFRLQVLLNPLGVPSRQNISQFLDVDLSECMRQDNKISYVSPYNTNDLQFVLDMKEAHDVKPKIFIDGRTGKPFERPIHWGTISLYKLHHMVKKKYHAIGMSSPVDPIYMQPRQSSKLDGGQSFGEMETWCLMSVGATHVLQEIFSYQSTDIRTRNEIRSQLETGQDNPYFVEGNNSNESTMLACYRSLGMDFKTNTEEGCFEVVPLTDSVIRSFSVMPVDSPANLHNSMIFSGASARLENKDPSRNVWGWIDLKMELIHPNFLRNSNILKLIVLNNTDSSFGLPIADAIMRGYVSVAKVNSKVPAFSVYRTGTCPSGLKGMDGIHEESVDAEIETITGMPGLVMMFKYSDTHALQLSAEKACESWLDKNQIFNTADLDALSDNDRSVYCSILAWQHFVTEFNNSMSLSDYVISSFPVMPQIYRPQFATNKSTEHSDFDWYYIQILNAVASMDRNRNVDTMYRVYDRIKSLCGLLKNITDAEKKYKNINSYFSGANRDDDHGSIRSKVQSKRVFCSGRTTIIPAHDTRLKPTEIGVPFTIIVKIYESQLIGLIVHEINAESMPDRRCFVHSLLLCAKRDRRRFCKYWDAHFDQCSSYMGIDAYNWLTKLIYDYVEGRMGVQQVVLAGRQPSLHKYAMRAYRPKIILENSLNVHTLVCSGYNADFDGDQMWILALISEEAKEEAIRLLSPAVDYVNPKDSSLILKHTQDVVLGLYCMSMLKQNATMIDICASDILHYSSIEQIRTDLEADEVKPWDVVCVSVDGNYYLGTAGRVYLNSLVHGFTNEPFTNPLCIDGIKPELYKEMKYDGIWRSGGNVKTGNFRYYKIADICMDIYNDYQDECLDVMQRLTELGFFYSDKFDVSLSLEDMMLQPEDSSVPVIDPDLQKLAEEPLGGICSAGLETANELQVAIEQDCYDGLISNEDKDDAVMTLYYKGTGDKESEYNKGVHTQVMDKVMTKLSKTQRNNNIFIMLDSGARGKADQVMRMCGFLPQLQKDKQTSLKTPVTHSFLQGLSSFDVHMISYSTKQGLASTQNETPTAGYATRKGVYMASGVQVVESDCGKDDWWYDVKYADIDEGRMLFIPNKPWFDENLVGKAISADDEKSLKLFGKSAEDAIIESSDYSKIVMSGGIHAIQFADNTGITVSLISLVGDSIHLSDKLAFTKLKNTLNGREITAKSLKLLQAVHLPEITTLSGTYTIKYKMDPCSKSLLLHRQCRDLPFTKEVYDPAEDTTLSFTTEETIKYIEEHNLRTVPVRILLDCKSKHGVCAHCYGLKFSSLKLPEVGEFVGTESAQAVGEPASQLTISLINQGGTAGASINDGVERFSSLLDGSITDPAILAPRSGYASIKLLGDIATVAIKPVDKNCRLCDGCAVNGECPTKVDRMPCAFAKTLNSQLLIVKDGDWVDASQPLTIQIPSPKNVEVVTVEDGKSITDTKEFKYVYRRKQTMWLQNYYETFSKKDIDINARHFEILTRIQNLQGFVYHSDNPNFQEGRTYDIMELLDAGDVHFEPRLSQRAKVIADNSGAMAALSFERIQSVAANLCVSHYKSSFKVNNSLLGSIAVGTDLTKGEPKVLGVTKIKHRKSQTSKQVAPVNIIYKDIESKKIDDEDDLFGNINFDEMFGNTSDTEAPKTIDIPEVSEATEIDSYAPQGFDGDNLDVTEEVRSSDSANPIRIAFGDEVASQGISETSDDLDDLSDNDDYTGSADSEEDYYASNSDSFDDADGLDDFDDLEDDPEDDLDDISTDNDLDESELRSSGTQGPAKMEF